jgi:hypothetical protein
VRMMRQRLQRSMRGSERRGRCPVGAGEKAWKGTLALTASVLGSYCAANSSKKLAALTLSGACPACYPLEFTGTKAFRRAGWRAGISRPRSDTQGLGTETEPLVMLQKMDQENEECCSAPRADNLGINHPSRREFCLDREWVQTLPICR